MPLSQNHANPSSSKPLKPKALAFLALFVLIGIITTVTFAVNIRAMLLLRSAFVEGGNWGVDFENITRPMMARVFFSMPEDVSNFHSMDFFKLTAMHVRVNNNMALWLAVIDVTLVNFFGVLRRISKLRVLATLSFGIIALTSPIIFLLSSSYAGF